MGTAALVDSWEEGAGDPGALGGLKHAALACAPPCASWERSASPAVAAKPAAGLAQQRAPVPPQPFRTELDWTGLDWTGLNERASKQRSMLARESYALLLLLVKCRVDPGPGPARMMGGYRPGEEVALLKEAKALAGPPSDSLTAPPAAGRGR